MGHKYVKEDETFNTSRNGTVPKPTAADISDYKVLRADGQWVQQSGGGGSTHTYSTTEQVVGTWIDGKPVYEKTCEYLNLNIRNTEQQLSTGILTAETIISFTGSFLRSSGVWENLPTSHTNTAFNVSPNDFDPATGNINLVVGAMNGMTVKDAYITIRYTKTTD